MFSQFLAGVAPRQQLPFETVLECYSFAFADPPRPELESGGKVILPPSTLDALARLQVVYPMLFNISSHTSGKATHCGVLEFVAPEGRCYLPHWMMRSLGMVDEGSRITVRNVSLKKAAYVKIEPQQTAFLDITNPKAVLENALRKFAALTVGDVIKLEYNNRDFELRIVECKPERAVCIIETDTEVDFAPPVGYVEPPRPQAAPPTGGGAGPATTPGGTAMTFGVADPGNKNEDASYYSDSEEDGGDKWAKLGGGTRVDGKKAPGAKPSRSTATTSTGASPSSRHAPSGFVSFSGQGNSIRGSR